LITLILRSCFLDRSNIGNARLIGLERDLGMKGLDYNIGLAAFFPLYLLFEIPSNIMIKRIRPSLWLPFIMVCWGLIMTCTGLVHNFRGLVACRILLGSAEAGLYPGVAFLITTWYRRHETGFRLALFFSAATGAGAFGGLLARAISDMDGVGGKAGWSWIFILEGLLALFVAVLGFWAIHDYPET
jgi:MFS family permease